MLWITSCIPNLLVLTWNCNVHLVTLLYYFLFCICAPRAAPVPQNRIFYADIMEEQPQDTRIFDVNKELHSETSVYLNYSKFGIVANNPVISRFVHINPQTGILFSSRRIDRDMLCSMYKLCCSITETDVLGDTRSPVFHTFRRTADNCQFVFRVIYKVSAMEPQLSFGSGATISADMGRNFTYIPKDHSRSVNRTEYCTVVLSITDINDNVPRFLLPRESEKLLNPSSVSSSIRPLSFDPVSSIELSVSELADVGTCFKLPSAIDEDSTPYSIYEYRMDRVVPSDVISLERHKLNGTIPTDLAESEQMFSLVQSACDHPSWSEPLFSASKKDTRHPTDGPIIDSNGWNQRKISAVQNGNVFLRLMNKLDRESRDEHWVKILALDGPSESMFVPQPAVSGNRQSGTFSRHTGTLLVRIHVLDENDNDPQVHPRMEFQVHESARIGTVIGAISATDHDLGDFGRVSYRLELNTHRSADSLPFAINQNSGAITVSRTLDADRMPENSQRRYQFRVICTDSAPAGQQRSAITEVTVQLINVNDETPQIKVIDLHSRSNPPRPAVLENQAPGQLVAFVIASDADSGLHGTITCHVSNDKFQLEIINSGISDSSHPSTYRIPVSPETNPSVGLVMDSLLPPGSSAVNELEFQLITRVSLDREQSPIEHVEIVCIDQDLVATDVRTGRASFKVLVLDENDNDPRFTTDKIHLRILENSPVNQMIAVLNATDADQSGALVTSETNWHGMTYLPTDHEYPSLTTGSATRLTYALDPEGEKYFRLDAHTGALYSRVQFDRELTDHLEVNVTAFDGGQPPRNVTARVHLTILDENDNSPQFERELYEVDLLENIPAGQVVATVHATDRDSGLNAEVVYQMEDLLVS